MADSRLILSQDLGEFFRGELSVAKGTTGIALPDATEFYLVNLLCDFSKDSGTAALADEPLALLYKRALEATAGERLQLLKSLGDLALYVAGFFSEFIERSLVDVDYYISMGGNAYGNLSGFWGAQRRGSSFADLYEQLAKRFTDLVELLNAVSDRMREKAGGNGDLLKLYERWLRSGDQRLQQRLLQRGLLVTDGLPDDFVH